MRWPDRCRCPCRCGRTPGPSCWGRRPCWPCWRTAARPLPSSLVPAHIKLTPAGPKRSARPSSPCALWSGLLLAQACCTNVVEHDNARAPIPPIPDRNHLLGAVKADTFRRGLDDLSGRPPSIPSGGPEAVNAIKGLRPCCGRRRDAGRYGPRPA